MQTGESRAAAWACERSIDVDVPVAFAWRYMTDVRNWSDPPAEFELAGPFVEGARGATRMPDRAPLVWTLCNVRTGQSYTIASSSFLEGATLLAHWRFDQPSEHRSTLTQRLELTGDAAASYVESMRAAFEPNLEPGLRRIAALMTASYHATQG
jgi:hypothetical protein